MTQYKNDDPNIINAANAWGEITLQLNALKGKTDIESMKKFDELLDKLMCADGSLKPMKDAMGEASKKTSLSNS